MHHYQTVSERRMDLMHLLSQQPLGTHLYVCGPEGMIDAVLQFGKEAGWPQPAFARGTLHSAPRRRFRSLCSWRVLSGPVAIKEDESILQALESAGLEPPFLCRGGACGQCETKVLACDGTLLHNDHYLSDDEKTSGEKIMICFRGYVDRRLTLDL